MLLVSGALAAACAAESGAPEGGLEGPVKVATPGSAMPGPSSSGSAQAADAGPSDEPPAFSARPVAIDAELKKRMTASWRTGCPVPLEDLRLIAMNHWGIDGSVHDGELVVHQDAVDAVMTVFRKLFEDHYPIERMELVDVFDADDTKSMEANNTSAFNCRKVAGSTKWSQHSYGRAIDLNPRLNPAVEGTKVSPENGKEFADRTLRTPGLIHAGDATVKAFAAVGWPWGGDWKSFKDYQHFSATGR